MITSHRKTVSETLGRNPVHPFPARMAPGIALDILSTKKRKLRVLDPMMGSGTVLAVARSRGHRAMGVDIDPLSVLIAKVWTSTTDVGKVERKAKAVLGRARNEFREMRAKDAYPRKADKETRAFVRYWFDPYARRQLASLAKVISRSHDETVRNVLWCAFSRLIITKQSGASLASDLAHSRPHKVYETAPFKPFRKFSHAVRQVVENCITKNDKDRGPATRIYNSDARKLALRGNTVDLVLTSPPYLNAIDYMRCSKFTLIWMGYSIEKIRRIRNGTIGTEAGDEIALKDKANSRIIRALKLDKKLADRDRAVLARYITDLRRSVSEVARVLAPGGKAIYVVGENTIHGSFIRNAAIVEKAARSFGLRLSDRRTRKLPANRRYLPPPARRPAAKKLDTRMAREVVLAFRKPRRRKRRLMRRRYSLAA